MMMKRLFHRRRKVKPHLPGAPPPPTTAEAAPTRITVIDYDEFNFQERQIKSAEECLPFRNTPTVTWINVDGLRDAHLLEQFGSFFGLHPLVIEDILNTEQRPKVDFYEDYIYVVLKQLAWDPASEEVVGEQLSLILGSNFVLSFQELPGDLFDPIREKIRKKTGRIRKLGPDYLLYTLLDAIVDNYFVILEKLGEQIELIEEELLRDPAPITLHRTHRQRREMIFLRRSIWPLREVISGLEREESPLIKNATDLFLRDVYDHTIRIMDTVETYRDMLAGMLDMYLSSVSNKLNAVMKVLTIIATIFIPLTFFAGVYGMNFKHMPELEWKYGYAFAWAIMAASAGAMLLYFRKKGWL
jgi:magnesium transporter